MNANEYRHPNDPEHMSREACECGNCDKCRQHDAEFAAWCEAQAIAEAVTNAAHAACENDEAFPWPSPQEIESFEAEQAEDARVGEFVVEGSRGYVSDFWYGNGELMFTADRQAARVFRGAEWARFFTPGFTLVPVPAKAGAEAI